MLPPTGEAVEYTGVSMYRIEDGKIAEIWEARNTLSIMRQLDPKYLFTGLSNNCLRVADTLWPTADGE